MFLGGAVGTAARAAFLAIPVSSTWPVAVLAVNVGGSFLLGALLEVLSRAPSSERGTALRLLFGTGLLGGFTTYSALALDAIRLGIEGDWMPAVAYPLASVLLGLAAAGLGVVAAHAVTGRTPA